MNAALPDTEDRMMALLAAQRQAWRDHGPLDGKRRVEALDGLAQAVIRHGDGLVEAISQDFGHRSPAETKLADLYPVVAAARHARRHLRRWMKPRRRPVGLPFRPGTGRVVYQPLGIVGIVSPWNYPVQLALSPLVGAVAAGNRVMIKPSEGTPRTAALLSILLAEVFDHTEVAVVQGGPDLAQAFTRLTFDHLLFTGSTAVGRAVMSAAAERLVPVTLELGGKSPVLIAPDYPVEAAAERVAVGKLFNAGQTCIAPDYALVPHAQVDVFARAYLEAAARLYPHVEDNPDYTAIVSDRHYRRLTDLIADARERGAAISSTHPPETAAVQRKIPPTLLRNVPEGAAALREEIFGPLLPVVPYHRIEDAYAFIGRRPAPLALYLFSRDRGTIATTLERTVSGGVAVNDTLLQGMQEELPFGGVGESGMGAYHGEAGFRTFSHTRSVFHQARINGSRLTSPPYGTRIDRLLAWILR